MAKKSVIKPLSVRAAVPTRVAALALLCLAGTVFAGEAAPPLSGSSSVPVTLSSDKLASHGAAPTQDEYKLAVSAPGEQSRFSSAKDRQYSVTPRPDAQNPRSNKRPPALSGSLDVPAQTVFTPDADHYDRFGYSISLSADGTTLVAGVPHESRRQRIGEPGSGVMDNVVASSGAAVVYVRRGGHWIEQAWLKPTDSVTGDSFGYSVSVSADGTVLAVGAPFRVEENAVTEQPESDHSAELLTSGLAYIFVRSETGEWTQEALLRATQAQGYVYFGTSVTLSGDGRVLVVGCNEYKSETKTAYVYTRSKGLWRPEDSLKIRAPRKFKRDNPSPLALNHDGSLLAAGVPDENTVLFYERGSQGWQLGESVTLPKSNTLNVNDMGMSVALSGTGSRLAASARETIFKWKTADESTESCDADCRAQYASRQHKRAQYCLTNYKKEDCLEINLSRHQLTYPVLYIYEQTQKGWHMQVRQRLLPAIVGIYDPWDKRSDYDVSMSQDGRTVIVGNIDDDVPATGFVHTEEEGIPVIEDEIIIHKENAILKRMVNFGAAWLTVYKDGTWQEPVRFQAPAPEHDDRFGRSVSIDANGQTIAVSAPRRDTPRGDRPALLSFDDDIHDAGSVFIYTRPSTGE